MWLRAKRRVSLALLQKCDYRSFTSISSGKSIWQHCRNLIIVESVIKNATLNERWTFQKKLRKNVNLITLKKIVFFLDFSKILVKMSVWKCCRNVIWWLDLLQVILRKIDLVKLQKFGYRLIRDKKREENYRLGNIVEY